MAADPILVLALAIEDLTVVRHLGPHSRKRLRTIPHAEPLLREQTKRATTELQVFSVP